MCWLPTKCSRVVGRNLSLNIKCKAYNFSDAEKIIKNLYHYKEPYFHFNEIIFDLTDDVIYTGNFQSEKYFNHCKESIIEQFTFKQEIYNKSSIFIDNLKSENKQLVSLHVRRGDYLSRQHEHPVQTIEWYKLAMNVFDSEKTIFLIFSDDIAWCKHNLTDQKRKIVYSSLSSDYEDLCAMTLCDSNIIANSSFSWWGAWLNNNKNKKVIAHKNWFGPAYKKHNTKDLFCNDWIVI